MSCSNLETQYDRHVRARSEERRSACGANNVAVVIPCHRVTRGDGAIGGYAYGPERKRVLLAREATG